jgi:hypothetical protein
MKHCLFAFTLLAGVGCMNMQPVGPMTKVLPPKPRPSDPTEPQVVPAPKPVPPAALIQPSDVTDDNAEAVTRKLMNELEADRKTMGNGKTAEISRIQGGVKVQ